MKRKSLVLITNASILLIIVAAHALFASVVALPMAILLYAFSNACHTTFPSMCTGQLTFSVSYIASLVLSAFLMLLVEYRLYEEEKSLSDNKVQNN